MDIKQRLKILKESQTPPSPTGTQTQSSTPTTVPTTPIARIDINSVPNFNAVLFSKKPEIVGDLNNIINIMNKYLVTLTNNKVTFNMVWTNPSITGSDFTNSVKNLLNLSKWMYNVIRSRSEPYSIDGLRAIGTGLINTVKSYSFPEPQASNVQGELMAAGQNILNRLGTTPR